MTQDREQRRVLILALVLNAAMFAIEVTAGVLTGSAGLIADGLDMLSDAAVYALALVAIARSTRFKANAALFSGWALFALGIVLLAEVGRRVVVDTAPEGIWMMAIGTLALVVNVVVLRLLAEQRDGEVHMRAAWIFTRADVVANAALLLAGGAVLATGWRWFDLAVGAAIGLYVLREALEIVGEARAAQRGL